MTLVFTGKSQKQSKQKTRETKEFLDFSHKKGMPQIFGRILIKKMAVTRSLHRARVVAGTPPEVWIKVRYSKKAKQI